MLFVFVSLKYFAISLIYGLRLLIWKVTLLSLKLVVTMKK